MSERHYCQRCRKVFTQDDAVHVGDLSSQARAALQRVEGQLAAALRSVMHESDLLMTDGCLHCQCGRIACPESEWDELPAAVRIRLRKKSP
jgi:hypothetical protein